jgi:thymidylate synthase
MDKMLEELKPYYPNLTKGHYTHFVHSLHIYDRDEKKILAMLGLSDEKE